VAATQRDAIRSAVSTRREPQAVFAALSSMIEKGYQVTAAAQGIRDLPRDTWPADGASAAAHALVEWASKTHTSERSGRDYVETIQVADTLAATLPSPEGEALRKKLLGLRINVYVVRAVVEGMRYDTPRIVAPAGKSFEIIFENPDVMPHNMVVVEPGARQRVGTAAMELPPDNLDRSGRAWVPESREIIAATKMLETGQSETLRLRPIREEGTYEYVCTFPGHWTVMYGQLIVTKDVNAYMKSNPVATTASLPSATVTATGSHAH
jgi:azurin